MYNPIETPKFTHQPQQVISTNIIIQIDDYESFATSTKRLLNILHSQEFPSTEMEHHIFDTLKHSFEDLVPKVFELILATSKKDKLVIIFDNDLEDITGQKFSGSKVAGLLKNCLVNDSRTVDKKIDFICLTGNADLGKVQSEWQDLAKVHPKMGGLESLKEILKFFKS